MQAQKAVIGIAVVLFLVIAGLFYHFVLHPEPAAVPVAAPEAPEIAPVGQAANPMDKTPPPPRISLPDLNESDELVRRYLSACSDDRDFRHWIQVSDLIRRFVAAVDNIAHGNSPASHLSILNISRPFETKGEGGRLTIDPASFQRFDRVVSVFLSLRTDRLRSLFHDLEPLFDDALRELGYPEKAFKETLWEAMAHLLATPVPNLPIAVEKKLITYTLVDAHLESLTPAQKHLIRMGPQHIRRVQEQTKKIARELDLWER